jgi:hypothetical protein
MAFLLFATASWPALGPHPSYPNAIFAVLMLTLVSRRFTSTAAKPTITADISLHNKVKVKLSLCFNLAPRYENVFGSGSIALRIFDLGTRWR